MGQSPKGGCAYGAVPTGRPRQCVGGRHCGCFAARTNLGLGADSLVSLGFGKLSLFTLEFVPLEQRDPEIGIIKNAIHDLFRSVQAVLTNGGDDLMRHPPLERLGFGLAGTQDEGIQAGFGNDGKIPDLIRILYGAGRKLVFIQHF